MSNNLLSTRKEMQNQLMDLKAEILTLSAALAEKVSDAGDHARPFVEDAGRLSGDAANAAFEQGRAVLAAVRHDPRTATTVALTAGVTGLAIGWLIGSAALHR